MKYASDISSSLCGRTKFLIIQALLTYVVF